MRPSRCGVEWLQCQAVVQRGQERLEDRGDGVAFDQLDLGAVGFGFEIVDVNADGYGLMPVFEVSAPMGLEEQVAIAGDLSGAAPDKAGGVLIDGRSEGDLHLMTSPR